MIKVCDHSSDSYRAVLTCGTVNYVSQDGSYMYVQVFTRHHSNESYFALLYRVVDKTLVCDLSLAKFVNDSSRAVLSHPTV